MFSLLVSANRQAWEGEPYVFAADRVIRENEFTDREMVERFGDHSSKSFDELMRYPCIFAIEDGRDLPARLGWITRVRVRGQEIRVEYEIDNAIPEIENEVLKGLEWELGISQWELNRTHWAIKNANIAQELHDSGVIDINSIRAAHPQSRLFQRAEPEGPAVRFTPSVFRVPVEPADPSLVSLMMPFGGFQDVHEALRQACEDVGAICQRADEVWEENEVMQDVFSLIYRSKVVICDFSGRNPNVFYEAGIAHTLGRSVIPIIQNPEDWPFDLQHHRYLRYLKNGEGLRKLTEDIKPRLRRLLAEP